MIYAASGKGCGVFYSLASVRGLFSNERDVQLRSLDLPFDDRLAEVQQQALPVDEKDPGPVSLRAVILHSAQIDPYGLWIIHLSKGHEDLSSAHGCQDRYMFACIHQLRKGFPASLQRGSLLLTAAVQVLFDGIAVIII